MFWHADEQIKTPEQLFKIYLECVGRNATLIMNCAPNTDGVLSDAVVESLEGLGELLEKTPVGQLRPPGHERHGRQRPHRPASTRPRT